MMTALASLAAGHHAAAAIHRLLPAAPPPLPISAAGRSGQGADAKAGELQHAAAGGGSSASGRGSAGTAASPAALELAARRSPGARGADQPQLSAREEAASMDGMDELGAFGKDPIGDGASSHSGASGADDGAPSPHPRCCLLDSQQRSGGGPMKTQVFQR